MKSKESTSQLDASHSSAERIASRLRLHLLAGKVPEDLRLPSVRTLARRYSVGPATVQAAYRALAAEGLVEARPRLGWFVVPRAGRMRRKKALANLQLSVRKPIRCALDSGLSRYVVRREILRMLSRQTGGLTD